MRDTMLGHVLKDFLVAYYSKNLNWTFRHDEPGEESILLHPTEFFDYGGYLPGFAQYASVRQQELGINAFMLKFEQDPHAVLGKRIVFEDGQKDHKLRFMILALMVDSVEAVCGDAVPNREINVKSVHDYFIAPTPSNEKKLPCYENIHI